MAKQKRNTHSPEFKAKVALEAVRGVQTVNEIAQQYEVHPVQVSQWKKALLAELLVFFLNGHLFADYIEQVDKFPDYFDRRYFRLA
jgi:transposase-like protein